MVCFDSTILIDILRGNKEAKEFIEKCEDEGEEIMVSSICAMELAKGVYFASNLLKEKIEIQELLSQFTELPFTHEIAFEAGRIDSELEKKGETIQIEDVMIGATAKINNQTLITRNLKHFERIKNLNIKTY